MIVIYLFNKNYSHLDQLFEKLKNNKIKLLRSERLTIFEK
jgi:hypothetical protein